MLVEAGVHQIGFPLRLAFHREDTSEEEAARILQVLPPAVPAVLITYVESASEIRSLCQNLGVRSVQLHSNPPVSEVAALRAQAPEVTLMKSLIVRGTNLPELLSLARLYEPHVAAFITDTYDPSTGACGATGLTHDWDISRELARKISRPLILAGGLNPGNVRQAILHVCPAGVDVHTGVEGPDGRKDPGLVKAFVSEALSAFADKAQDGLEISLR
jgi:phosphoribosylanthranilate isomerase